jgi:hypothetical protein
LGAVDGRPRKGQESVGEGPEGFNAIGQPQKGRMHAGAAGGVHRGFKDDGSRGGVEAAGELISGRPAKDVEADRTVTRLGLVRIRAPDVSQSNVSLLAPPELYFPCTTFDDVLHVHLHAHPELNLCSSLDPAYPQAEVNLWDSPLPVRSRARPE